MFEFFATKFGSAILKILFLLKIIGYLSKSDLSVFDQSLNFSIYLQLGFFILDVLINDYIKCNGAAIRCK